MPIHSIIEGNDSNLLVSTDIGIFKIESATGNINHITSDSKGFEYCGKAVSVSYVDNYKNYWIATEAGITKIDCKTGTSVCWKLSDYSQKPFLTTYVHCIYQDSYDNIWITTREEGVFMMPAFSDSFIRFYHREGDKYCIGSNETYDIYEDTERQIWISTNGGGLNLFDRHTGRFTRIKHVPNDKNGLLNNNIRTIFKDRQGNLWIASFQAGINISINHPLLFKNYDLSHGISGEYQSPIVCSVNQYDENILWIGTDGGGLKLFNRKKNTSETFLPEKNNPGSFPDKVVMAIYRDRSNTFWFGTYQAGLVKYDHAGRKFITYSHVPNDPYSINSNFVTEIHEDVKGNLWVGTNGGGLNLFDRNTGEFRTYRNVSGDTNSLINDYINDIAEDQNGDLWIGTYWGLSRYNTNLFTFTSFLQGADKTNSITHNTVFCLLVDSKNHLWVGTRNGLNLYNRENQQFSYFNKKGLSGCSVYGILEDNSGNLWVSGNNGLTCFNPATGEVLSFTEADGLQGKEFFRNSSFKNAQGELFFGGINGLNAFFPDDIRPREYQPEVVITGFRIFDKPVISGKLSDGRIIHDHAIEETKHIRLRHSDKVFSFEVAALDFITPENIVFAYQLEGFDENWNYTTATYPVITYTNLSPGQYLLHIKAGNENIIDRISKDVTLEIRITPPLWKTWWALVFYLLLLLAGIYYIWKLSIKRIKEKEMVRVEILKREKLEELNRAKLRFFTNISHEFRTPLTLIISPLEQILKKGTNQSFNKQFSVMLNNARRMLRLINQLLDFRKIEGGAMELKAECADIVDFIKNVAHAFEEHAIEKNISLAIDTAVETYMLWFDPDKMDKVLFNLLSNAFKFTPARGKVLISIRHGIILKEPSNHISFTGISVTDTGPGISEKDLPYIFERFYQGENSQLQSGSGIGLALSKSFVEMHRGTISVSSSPGETTFQILIPEGDLHLSTAQKTAGSLVSVIQPEQEHLPEHADESLQVKNKPTVLLIEDHAELRSYIEEECREYFAFYSASDGAEGYEMAIDILPDLIISDIMMPGMDGYQFCRKVKVNMLTSHIPVILLTSKTSTDNQIRGYESGADAYIPKPFRIDQLIATANSIIENRIRLREKFNAGKILSEMPVKNTADDKFLQKVTDLVNNNLNEVDFGVQQLSREIGISRVHLHRKLKAIANVNPNEFIKSIRLQQALILLQRKEFTISEVCYKVGFNSPAYFSSCFRSYYHMSPSEYLEKNHQT